MIHKFNHKLSCELDIETQHIDFIYSTVLKGHFGTDIIAKSFFHPNCRIMMPLQDGDSTYLSHLERKRSRVSLYSVKDRSSIHFQKSEHERRGKILDTKAEEEVEKMVNLSESLCIPFSIVCMGNAKHIAVKENGWLYPYLIIDQAVKQVLETEKKGVVGKVFIGKDNQIIKNSKLPSHKFYLGDAIVEIIVGKDGIISVMDTNRVLHLLSNKGDKIVLDEKRRKIIREYKKSILMDPILEKTLRFNDEN